MGVYPTLEQIVRIKLRSGLATFFKSVIPSTLTMFLKAGTTNRMPKDMTKSTLGGENPETIECSRKKFTKLSSETVGKYSEYFFYYLKPIAV